MPRPRAVPWGHVGAPQSRLAHGAALLLGALALPVRAREEVLPDWATTPEPTGRQLSDISTSTTKWGTTKTTITAPGTLNLDQSAAVTKSEQPLPTKPWSHPSAGQEHCSSRFRVPEQAPNRATDLNGIALPDTCFTDDGPHHVFVIGDWGGIFNGQDKPISPADRRSKHMPTHHRPFVMGADDCAQRNVAAQMNARSNTAKPDYVLNVGDNFYWGGVLVKCGGPPGEVDDPVGQWTWVFEKMYDGLGLQDKQWLGVLGNHDFGGFLFTHGWDQAIGYTWSKTETSTKRWLTPALYWKSKVRYNDFSVDYYFVDSNTFDAMHPDSDPGHNLCSRKHNLPVGATCGVIGPVSIDECPVWFRRLWTAQVQWIRNALAESEADWQVIVTHFPPIRGWGDDVWKGLSREFGIDLIVTGHVHKQEVHYMGPENQLAPTAYVISGGGGGITSEDVPHPKGEDDQYGFMDLTLTKKEIMIEAISHGGQLRKRVCVHPRLRGGDVEHVPGPSLCDEAPTQQPAPAPQPAPQPAAWDAAPAAAPASPEPAASDQAASAPSPAFSEVVHTPAQVPQYLFIGFATPAEARAACGAGKHLAMPKTLDDLTALLGSMSLAQGEGYMSTTWPENTVWLGGHWHAATRQWLWDDGSDIQNLNWAQDEPSGGPNQADEPWLCMLLTGELCDSSAANSFGVFCEDEEVPEGFDPAAAAAASSPASSASQAGAEPEPGSDIMQDIAAAIEARSWSSVQVHTALPVESDAGLDSSAVVQKDEETHSLRLLRHAWTAKARTLVACGATAAVALTALVILAATRRPRGSGPRRIMVPDGGAADLNDRACRPLVPYKQLLTTRDPTGVEVA